MLSILAAHDGQFAYERIALVLLDQDELSTAVYYGFADPGAIQFHALPLQDFPILRDLLANGTRKVFEAGSDNINFERILQLKAPGQYLLAPLDFHDQPLGALLFYLEQRPFSQQEIQFADLMADQIAFKIGSTSIYSERQKKMLHLEIASQVSKKVNSILDLDQLLNEVVRLVRGTFGYDHVHIFLVDGHTHQIVLQVLSGEKKESLKEEGLRFDIGSKAITAWVAANGKTLIANDVDKEPLYSAHTLLPNVRSEAALPMRIGDTVVGVLDVQSKHPNAFDEDDISTLQIVADQTAIGIENAHLFRETRRQAEMYQVLHEISLEITSQLENDRVLHMILKHAARFLSATASSLAIFDEKSETLTITASYNNNEILTGTTLNIGEGVVGQVVATRGPVFVNNYQAWQHRSPKLSQNRFSAVLGVPLWRREKIIGSLIALDYRDRRRFSETDAQKLALFADFASIALKKYELFDEIRKSRLKLERKVVKQTGQLSETQVALHNTAEELRRLLEATVNVQEEERARIALDLHDGSNQLITGILFELQAAQQSILNNNVKFSLKKLETAKSLLRTIEAENRRIISGLRPTILDTDGLIPALKWYMDERMGIYPLRIKFRVRGKVCPLPPQVETGIFRIVQESLHNIIEHAAARHITIRIDFRPQEFRLAIRDDGIGADFESSQTYASGKLGLIGMKERAQSIHGSLNFISHPGEGVTITLSVPIRASEGNAT